MKSRSLTTWIVAALFIGVIVGFALNKLATPGLISNILLISQW